MKLSDLVGLAVKDARRVGEDIVLNLINGSAILLRPYGDCCANCYVQHVSGAEALRNATVTAVEDIESKPTDEEIEAADVLDAWGHRITTTRGTCSIEMRLDHNGYYGGTLKMSVFDASDGPLLEDF